MDDEEVYGWYSNLQATCSYSISTYLYLVYQLHFVFSKMGY